MLPSSPCSPWPLDLDCCTGLPDDPDPALVEKWAMVATTSLFALSGRRLGPSCPLTIRPCMRSCLERAGVTARWGTAGRWVPYIGRGGGWFNASICSCTTDCSCTDLCEVWLEGPVYDIESVIIDGETLDPDQYRLDLTDRGTMLVRTDGGCWPECSDMAADCGEPGAFCVTLRHGLPLDQLAIAAVSEYTCELVKNCIEGCECRLPGTVRRVIRQGVVVEMTDPTGDFAEALAGRLPLVGAFLATVNPNGLPNPPRVYSTNLRRPRITPWEGESS